MDVSKAELYQIIKEHKIRLESEKIKGKKVDLKAAYLRAGFIAGLTESSISDFFRK